MPSGEGLAGCGVRGPLRDRAALCFRGSGPACRLGAPLPAERLAVALLYVEGGRREQQGPISRPGETGLDLTQNSPHLLPRLSPDLSIGSHRQLTQDAWGVAYEQRGP